VPWILGSVPVAICDAGGTDTYAWTFFFLIVGGATPVAFIAAALALFFATGHCLD